MPDEGDLHRFVDGLLDATRQREMLARLKSSAGEAAQVAAWREQNELLRGAFAGVEHEFVPASLRLTPLRLRCIGDEDHDASDTPPQPIFAAAPARRWRAATDQVAIAMALCLAAAVAGASWLLLDHAVTTKPRPLAFESPASDDIPPMIATTEEEALPTAAIPDLAPLGFEFTGATVDTVGPKTLVFSYQDNASTPLTLSVSRLGERTGSPAAGGALGWERGGRRFVLAGDPDRLPIVAAYLQSLATAR